MSLEAVHPQPNRTDPHSYAPEHYEQPSLQFNDSVPSSTPVSSPPVEKYEPFTSSYGAESQNTSRPDDRHGLHRLPFGCTPLLFGVVTALITAVIVGAAVGGGVGGALASRNKCKTTSIAAQGSNAPLDLATTTILSCPTPTATSTASSSSTESAAATSYTPLPYTSIASLARDCPTLDNKTYSTTLSNQEWTLLCDMHYINYDIVTLFAYTWQDCIDACAGVNYSASKAAGGVEGGELTCQHAMFQARTDGAYNCWCKYKGATVGTPDPARMLLSADLLL